MSTHQSFIPFTAVAYHKLEQDLERLLIEEKEVLVRLQTAREMGDLSENGAYKYAKFELGNIRRQLRQTQHLVSSGQVVASKKSDQVEFGSSVTVSDGHNQKVFLIVSKHESDPVQNKISMESPLGKALLGKKAGDTALVETPRGTITYRLLRIE